MKFFLTSFIFFVAVSSIRGDFEGFKDRNLQCTQNTKYLPLVSLECYIMFLQMCPNRI
jgi:hypothetical protein